MNMTSSFESSVSLDAIPFCRERSDSTATYSQYGRYLIGSFGMILLAL